MGQGDCPETILKQAKRRRKGAQKLARKMLEEMSRPDNPWLRGRLNRWELGGMEARRVDRLLCRIKEVNSDTPPRVASSYISFIWNGLGTARRWQKKGRCVLCQRSGTWDSIEHYAQCTVLMGVAGRVFGLHPPKTSCNSISIKNRLEWFLLLDGGRDLEDRTKHFLFLYFTYRLQNCCRQEGVEVVGRGVDWKCRSYVEGRVGEGGSKSFQEVLRGIVTSYQAAAADPATALAEPTAPATVVASVTAVADAFHPELELHSDGFHPAIACLACAASGVNGPALPGQQYCTVHLQQQQEQQQQPQHQRQQRQEAGVGDSSSSSILNSGAGGIQRWRWAKFLKRVFVRDARRKSCDADAQEPGLTALERGPFGPR